MTETLKAYVRHDLRRSATRRLRKARKIPAIIYGKERQPLPLAVDRSAFERLMGHRTAGALVQLDVEGEGTVRVIVQEVQRDAINSDILHIDFHQVSLNEPVDVSVPVRVIGEAELERRGAIPQLQLREVEVRVLPDRVPEAIEVNVADMSVGDVVRVKDLVVPEGVTVLEDAEEVVLTITEPDLEPVDAGTETEEPELVENTGGEG